MAESEEELKSLLMKVREENEKASSQKLWYIYTMEYYSAIRKNTFVGHPHAQRCYGEGGGRGVHVWECM